MANGRPWRVPHANGRCSERTHVTFPVGKARDICIDRPGELGKTDPDTAVLVRADWSIQGKLPIFQERRWNSFFDAFSRIDAKRILGSAASLIASRQRP